MVTRDARGHLLPGSRLNPRGHTTRGLSLAARFIMEEADAQAAQVLVDALNATKGIVTKGARGEPERIEQVPDWPTRLHAADLLHCRVGGRPTQPVENYDANKPLPVPLADLTDEELKALETLQRAQIRLREKNG